MIEVEIKLPLKTKGGKSDYDRVEDFLRKEGFQERSVVTETDLYFDSKILPVAEKGEALRIREIYDESTGKKETVVTFKGPKLDRISMTRREAETKVENAAEFRKLLEAMGFFHVKPAVCKHRHLLVKENMNACLDRVEGLGDFLELEIMTQENEDKNTALKQIEKMLERAGYAMTDTVTVSYLGMLQGRTEEK